MLYTHPMGTEPSLDAVILVARAGLLRVTPEDAEFWESHNFVVTSVKMIAAGVTGRRPDLGDNEKVHLSRAAGG